MKLTAQSATFTIAWYTYILKFTIIRLLHYLKGDNEWRYLPNIYFKIYEIPVTELRYLLSLYIVYRIEEAWHCPLDSIWNISFLNSGLKYSRVSIRVFLLNGLNKMINSKKKHFQSSSTSKAFLFLWPENLIFFIGSASWCLVAIL